MVRHTRPAPAPQKQKITKERESNMYSETLNENLALVGVIAPDAYVASSDELTEAIDMSKYHRVLFIVQTGTMGDTSTVNFEVQESITSDGTYTPIGGLGTELKKITQLSGSATPAESDSNRQVLVEVRQEELMNGKRFIKGNLTVGTAASDASVVALAALPRYAPVTHLTSVAEVLA
jgi:hypothetical protein